VSLSPHSSGTLASIIVIGKVEPRAKEKLRFFGAYDIIRAVGRITGLLEKMIEKAKVELKHIYVPDTVIPYFESYEGDSATKPPFIQVNWDSIGFMCTSKFGAKKMIFEGRWHEGSWLPFENQKVVNQWLVKIMIQIGKENRGEKR